MHGNKVASFKKLYNFLRKTNKTKEAQIYNFTFSLNKTNRKV
jgi:hypothetical protein